MKMSVKKEAISLYSFLFPDKTSFKGLEGLIFPNFQKEGINHTDSSLMAGNA